MMAMVLTRIMMKTILMEVFEDDDEVDFAGVCDENEDDDKKTVGIWMKAED